MDPYVEKQPVQFADHYSCFWLTYSRFSYKYYDYESARKQLDLAEFYMNKQKYPNILNVLNICEHQSNLYFVEN